MKTSKLALLAFWTCSVVANAQTEHARTSSDDDSDHGAHSARTPEFTSEQLIVVDDLIRRAEERVRRGYEDTPEVSIYAEAYRTYLQTGRVPTRPADSATANIPSPDDPFVSNVTCKTYRADDPHKGRGQNDWPVVKAKAEVKCRIVWYANVTPPPNHSIRWELVMNLFRRPGGQVGAKTWPKTGNPVAYLPNTGNGPDGDEGTQVFANNCINGNYSNRVTLFGYLPWPYYFNYGDQIRSRTRNATVDDCPQA